MSETQETLAELVIRGNIYYGIGGNTCQSIMADLINNLKDNVLPEKKEALLQAVMEREALMPTGIDNGIALPHPRISLLAENEKPFVTIAFPLIAPLDWSTIDNSKIHTVFLIVSKSPKEHLNVMSKISYLCKQTYFRELISKRMSREKIIAAIIEAESKW